MLSAISSPHRVIRSSSATDEPAVTTTHETASFWDSEAERYDAAYESRGRHGRVLRRRRDVALGLLGAGPGDILDAGMGPGRLLQALAECGWRVHGVDSSERMVQLAQTRIPEAQERLVRGSIENLPFPDSSFDAVVATGVLEYVAYSEAAISELARVLRPGGRAVLSVPRPGRARRAWRAGVLYPLARAVKRIVPLGRRAPVRRPPPPGDRAAEAVLEAAGLVLGEQPPGFAMGQAVYAVRKQSAPPPGSRSGVRGSGQHRGAGRLLPAHPRGGGDALVAPRDARDQRRPARDRLRDGGGLLDAGCGSGGFLRWAGERGRFEQLAGVDISAEAIEFARGRVPEADLQVASVWRLPFADASFDLVTLNDVLQHVPGAQIDRAVGELNRVIRPGGAILVRTNGGRRARGGADWRLYDRNSLVATLERAGFTVSRATYANLVGSLWAAARGRAPRAPSRDQHGIPSHSPGASNALMYALLRAEALWLRMRVTRVPYGHTLFAIAAPAGDRRR